MQTLNMQHKYLQYIDIKIYFANVGHWFDILRIYVSPFVCAYVFDGDPINNLYVIVDVTFFNNY